MFLENWHQEVVFKFQYYRDQDTNNKIPNLFEKKKLGYDHVTPTTDPGRIFTVFFGLIGIPLMFITAADIGKFLSEIVIR